MEEDINTDLYILESHLGGMLDRVHDNSQTLRHFQTYEKKLLSLNSLSEMVEYILDNTKEFFDLDVVSFCIIDEKDEISRYLADDGFKITQKPTLIFLQDHELLRTTYPFFPPVILNAGENFRTPDLTETALIPKCIV